MTDENAVRTTSTVSWWQVLGVASNAEIPYIETRYRELVRIHHPGAGGRLRKRGGTRGART